MRYSLIIPLYNREKDFVDLMESILKQDYTDYEVIVIDDGSTDNSGKIADEFAEKYQFVKVIHKQNGGLSSARNVGIENSFGQYLLFPDSDDLIKDDFFTNLDTLYGSDIIVFGYDIEYSKTQSTISFSNENVCVDIKEGLVTIEKCGAFNVAWNKAYKKDKIGELRFKNIMPVEDVVFNCEIFSRIKTVGLVSASLYKYIRKEDVSLATKYNAKLPEMIKIACTTRRGLYEKLGIESENETILRQKEINYAFSLVPNIFRKGNGLKAKEKYRQLKSVIKDKQLKKSLKGIKQKDFNHKFFKYNVNLGNGVIAFFNYSVLFFIRNKFTFLYAKIRRK